MRKKLLTFILIATVVFSFSACTTPKKEKSDKISVVTTLFPLYDFAREIAKDKAEITLLTPPGAESHSFEPKSTDMIKINECDLFIYTGENMEIWADKIISSLNPDKTAVCDSSYDIELLCGDEHEKEEEKHLHHHTYDPHIWTNPKNAIVMVKNICNSLCTADERNADFYKENAENYIKELENLDKEIRAVLKEKTNKKMIFASRFPFYYFIKEYGISYESAFTSCSGESEPDIKSVKKLKDSVEKENIKTVFYTELSDIRIPDAICEGTKAVSMLFHSCHNVTKDEFERGEGYLSLMKKNLVSLKEGLN